MLKADRGMIKWRPFDSVYSSKQIVREITREKEKIKMPIISEEEKNELEKKLILAYYEKEPIKVHYFYNGKIQIIEGIIKKIDFTFNKIYFNNKVILFDQIIKVPNNL